MVLRLISFGFSWIGLESRRVVRTYIREVEDNRRAF